MQGDRNKARLRSDMRLDRSSNPAGQRAHEVKSASMFEAEDHPPAIARVLECRHAFGPRPRPCNTIVALETRFDGGSQQGRRTFQALWAGQEGRFGPAAGAKGTLPLDKSAACNTLAGVKCLQKPSQKMTLRPMRPDR